MNKLGNILWGLVFVILAVIIALNSLGITSINIFFNGWWTLFIIVPAFISLIKDKDKTPGIIFLLVGVALLLGVRDIIDFNIIKKLILPAVLLIIGLSIIFKETISSNISNKIKEINKNNNSSNKDITAIFSGEELKFGKDEFKGLNLTAIFGGIDISLKECELDKDYVINTRSIFGGIDIIVPENVNVEVKSTSIFGGIDNKVVNSSEQNTKTIYVNAVNIFGGLDIN